MAKEITFNPLSISDIQKATEELIEYKKELNEKIDIFVKKLAEKGVEMAKDKITSYQAIDTGELLDSITLKEGDIIKSGSCYYIYTDCEYASFVEFGTGVLGEGTYIADFPDDISWDYASGTCVFTRKDGKTGWYYPTKDGKYRFTQGYPSRPFMTETAIMLSMDIVDIAKEVFGGDSYY
jgi:hypothetical protein